MNDQRRERSLSRGIVLLMHINRRSHDYFARYKSKLAFPIDTRRTFCLSRRCETSASIWSVFTHPSVCIRVCLPVCACACVHLRMRGTYLLPLRPEETPTSERSCYTARIVISCEIIELIRRGYYWRLSCSVSILEDSNWSINVFLLYVDVFLFIVRYRLFQCADIKE